MQFEEYKHENLNDITARRASGTLTQTSYTDSITWSDTSSESSDMIV